MEIKFINRVDYPDEYLIFENDKKLFTAVYRPENEVTELYDDQNCKVAEGILLREKWYQLVPSFLIELWPEQKEIPIRLKSFLFQTYTFNYDNVNYLIVQHFGYRYSFFKNLKQIAYYETYTQPVGNMRLVCDDDVNKALFCLVSLYLYSNFGTESPSLNYPFNLGIPRKRFDKKWEPNS